MPFRFLFLALGAFAMQCGSGRDLAPNELAKFDMKLRPLVEGTGAPGSECDSTVGADGITAYRVILRGNADDLRARGIPLVSSLGDVCTASLTVDQLREAARVPSVRSLECGSVNTIQNPPPDNR